MKWWTRKSKPCDHPLPVSSLMERTGVLWSVLNMPHSLPSGSSQPPSSVQAVYPVTTKQAAGLIDEKQTEVQSNYFSDKIMITIIQDGRLAQWVYSKSNQNRSALLTILQGSCALRRQQFFFARPSSPFNPRWWRYSSTNASFDPQNSAWRMQPRKRDSWSAVCHTDRQCHYHQESSRE